MGGGTDLKTFKFYCFNGEPKVLYISLEEDKYISYYDMAFHLLPCHIGGHEPIPVTLEKPDTFDEMVRIAKDLSSEFPFVRVDLYDAGGKVYISELTFLPTGGFMPMEPKSVLKEWGDWLQLPAK